MATIIYPEGYEEIDFDNIPLGIILSDKVIIHKCKENDNTIKAVMFEGKIDEILVGCEYVPSAGESVIGFNDLNELVEKAGYKLIKE